MSDDEIEERIEDLEAQLGEFDLSTVEQRVLAIEDEQKQLREDMDELVHSIREQGEETPHLDSVEALYERLVNIETNVATLREELETVIDDEP